MTLEPNLGAPIPRDPRKKDPLENLYQDLTNGRYDPGFTRPQKEDRLQHVAKFAVALEKAKVALETAIIRAAQHEHMGHLIQYCRDLNTVTVLQWKYSQKK